MLSCPAPEPVMDANEFALQRKPDDRPDAGVTEPPKEKTRPQRRKKRKRRKQKKK